MFEDNSKRDIWFEVDTILEATERYNVNSAIVKGALRAIDFWDEVDTEETVEDILRKIEKFILLSQEVAEKADIIVNGIAFIIENNSLIVLDLHNHRNKAEVQIEQGELKILSNNFEDTNRRDEMIQSMQRNKILIFEEIQDKNNKEKHK